MGGIFKLDSGDALLISNAMLLVPSLWLAFVVLREQLAKFGGLIGIIQKSYRIMRYDPTGAQAGYFEICIAIFFIMVGVFFKALAAWDFRFFDRPISNAMLTIGTAALVAGVLCGVRVLDRREKPMPYRIPRNWPWVLCGVLSIATAVFSYYFQY